MPCFDLELVIIYYTVNEFLLITLTSLHIPYTRIRMSVQGIEDMQEWKLGEIFLLSW